MKDLIKSWKFWAIVVAVLLVLTGVILYFTVPQFKDILTTVLIAAITFGVGYWIGTATKK